MKKTRKTKKHNANWFTHAEAVQIADEVVRKAEAAWKNITGKK